MAVADRPATFTAWQIDKFASGIIQDALQAVGDEMFEALRRTSMSPIIYEALDYAVGATDAQGNLLAQGNGVTAFLGSLDSAVRGALEHYDGGAGLSSRRHHSDQQPIPGRRHTPA